MTVQHDTDLDENEAAKRKENTPVGSHDALQCYDLRHEGEADSCRILPEGWPQPVTQHHVYLSVCQHGGTASANASGAPDTLLCNTRATLTPSKI